MEVEVKLRLRSAAEHQRLTEVLSPYHRRTVLQENLFFDGTNSELASNLAALRLRFYDADVRCVLSLKSKPQIAAGISRIEEQEEAIDPVLGRHCAAEPRRLFGAEFESSDIIRRAREEFDLASEPICLGGFRNVRGIYDWKGLKLEIDETHYSFGTSYEVECETSEPEIAKNMLEEMLTNNAVQYRYSSASKFAAFRAGKLL
ncbi:adenylate cyclase, partial [Genlisea aurea]